MWLIQTLICIMSCSEIQAELFSALSGMEALVKTEEILMESFHTYIKNQDYHLQLLKSHYSEYEVEFINAKKNVQTYLENPINVFKIIKRLHIDWPSTEQSLNYCPTSAFPNLSELKNSHTFPEADDLIGATDALIRLQNLYHLKNEDVADGTLKGKKYSLPMTTIDCFEYGKQLCNLKLYTNGTVWFQIALSKMENNMDSNLKMNILEYLAYSSYMKGDLDAAIKISREIIEKDPDHVKTLKNLSFYLDKREKMNKKEDFLWNQDDPRIPYYFKNYEELCRGELDISENLKKNLKCYYQSDSSPFLKLAPIKVEVHYLDPYVAVYHDVINDKEIKHVTEMAKSRLRRSQVSNFKTNISYKDQARISKTCWIKDWESEVIQKLNIRTTDITGLSLDFAEQLQVANYGTGGHYEPHFDFSKKSDVRGFHFGHDVDGNRIATFIYYLSDVEQGGRTVFPELGIGVTPRKGSALFWLNLHPSGEGNYATLHGACPVLQGTKWIANKWIRQRGQELRMQCALEYQDEGLIKAYPKPVFKLK